MPLYDAWCMVVKGIDQRKKQLIVTIFKSDYVFSGSCE